MGLAWWEQEEFVAADVLQLTDQEKEELSRSLVAFLEVVGARRILHCLEVSIADLEDCLYGIRFSHDELVERAPMIEELNNLMEVRRKIHDSIESMRTK